ACSLSPARRGVAMDRSQESRSKPAHAGAGGAEAGEVAEGVYGRGITLFRIAGIRIRLDYSWFLIFLLILASLAVGYLPREFPEQSAAAYWIAGAAATLLFFLSILIHEFSHAIVARLSGIRV